MSDMRNLEVPPKVRLEAAGFRIENLEADPSIIYLLQPDLRIIYCNKAWDRFATQNGGVGLERIAILGTCILDVIPEPLQSFFANGFAEARKKGQPWEHDYECSSPELFRLFHMRVLPLANSYFLVENSLRVERPHGSDRQTMPANAALYVSAEGILTMCSHCRRTRRIDTAEGLAWDWVPAFLVDPPGFVSHGLCRNCRAFFYP
jgi:hypothetical protein